MSLEQNKAIARAAHEALRSWYMATAGTSPHPPWEDLSDAQREKGRLAVMAIRDGIEVGGNEFNVKLFREIVGVMDRVFTEGDPPDWRGGAS